MNNKEEYLFRIACFIIASAKGCFREPKVYGPLRLLQTFLMIADLPKYVNELKEDEFIAKMRDEIEENLLLAMDEEEFKKFIDKLSLKIAKEIKKRKIKFNI